jgi:diaminopimelate epimerase
MRFSKYHGLGNDYLIYEPDTDPWPLTAKHVERICHRHYGFGADGILVGKKSDNPKAPFALTIYNPDGSTAEKSGNGLRIFARYLYDSEIVGEEPFFISTQGGIVECQILDHGNQVRVGMGKINFSSSAIPASGPEREILGEPIEINGTWYSIYAVSIGNPHCVLPVEQLSRELACEIGPMLETHPLFPQRTNVQLLKILDKKNLQIEIWERGAGYTLASGSSSCAAAAIARKMGIIKDAVTVHMPGGTLEIAFDDNHHVTLVGPVCYIGKLEMDEEALM